MTAPDSARERIVKAANRLFYGVGIKSVSMDDLARKAGVTKKTIYYHFRSKDELIEAYLASRDRPNLEQLAKWYQDAEGCVEDRIRAIFEKLAVATQSRHWKGCGFLRTSAELVDMPGHPAVKIASQHKKRVEAWLATVLATDGYEWAEVLARQIVLLLDGAFSAMLVHRDAAYILSAGDAAVALLRNAKGARGKRETLGATTHSASSA